MDLIFPSPYSVIHLWTPSIFLCNIISFSFGWGYKLLCDPQKLLIFVRSKLSVCIALCSRVPCPTGSSCHACSELLESWKLFPWFPKTTKLCFCGFFSIQLFGNCSRTLSFHYQNPILILSGVPKHCFIDSNIPVLLDIHFSCAETKLFHDFILNFKKQSWKDTKYLDR